MKRFTIAIAAGILLAGCAQESTTILTPHELPQLASRKVEGTDLEVFAQALAKSFAVPAVRAKMRDAWRDSRLSTDHKLVTSFFTSSEGATVLAEMARSGGLSTDELLASIRRLPELDIYMPIRAHRRTWKATDDVLVAGALDHNVSQVQAYDVNGDMHVVTGEAAESGRPLVIMHRAEPKYQMQGEQLFSTGEVIEREDSYKPVTDAEEQRGSPATYSLISYPNLLTTSFRISYFDTWGGDGPFGGDLEMEFRLTGEQSSTPTNCSIGTGSANLPENPPQWTDIYVVYNVTSIAAGCGAPFSDTSRILRMRNVEVDFSTSFEDDFGMRLSAYSGSGLPYGLNIDTTERAHPFYDGSGTTSNTKMTYLHLWIH